MSEPGWRRRRRIARRNAARQAGTTAWRVTLRELRAALRTLAGRPDDFNTQPERTNTHD